MMIQLIWMKAQELLNREDGQDLIEYALLVALIALACAAALPTLATAITGVYTKIEGDL